MSETFNVRNISSIFFYYLLVWIMIQIRFTFENFVFYLKTLLIFHRFFLFLGGFYFYLFWKGVVLISLKQIIVYMFPVLISPFPPLFYFTFSQHLSPFHRLDNLPIYYVYCYYLCSLLSLQIWNVIFIRIEIYLFISWHHTENWYEFYEFYIIFRVL